MALPQKGKPYNPLYGEDDPTQPGVPQQPQAAPGNLNVSEQMAEHMAYDPQAREAVGNLFGTPEGREQAQGVIDMFKPPANQGVPGVATYGDFFGGAPAGGSPAAPASPAGSASAAMPGAVSTGSPTPGAVASGATAQPDFTAGRPTRTMDSWGTGRRIGLALSAGAMEFGRPGSGSGLINSLYGRDEEQRRAQQEFDQNVPFRRAAYNKEVTGTQLTQAEIAHQQQETSNLAMNNPATQRKAAFLAKLGEQVAALKDHPDQMHNIRAQAAREAMAGNIPVTMKDIDDYIANPIQIGSQKYQVITGEGGRPEGLKDAAGYAYGPGNIPNDQQAQSLWNNAQQQHAAKRQEKLSDEMTVAGYAASRQAAGTAEAINAGNVTEQRKQEFEGKKQALTHLQTMNEAHNQLNLVNDLASSKSPTDQTSLAFKALGLDLPDGVHRINDTELTAIKNQGALTGRAYRAILNWTTGQTFEPEIIQDIKRTAAKIASSKIAAANDNLSSVNRVYGFKVQGSDDQGRMQSFSRSAYQSANPKGDVNAAAAEARKNGYLVMP